jgi:hypothetical protein
LLYKCCKIFIQLKHPLLKRIKVNGRLSLTAVSISKGQKAKLPSPTKAITWLRGEANWAPIAAGMAYPNPP